MRVFTDFKSKSKDKRKVVYKPFFVESQEYHTCLKYQHLPASIISTHSYYSLRDIKDTHTHTHKPQQQSNTCNSPILRVGGTKHSLVTK